MLKRRHDNIRDLLAEMIDDVANNVLIETPLQTLTGEVLEPGAKRDYEARLNVAARDFWQRRKMAFFDARIFNPLPGLTKTRNLSKHSKARKRRRRKHIMRE